ncbi:hypothetical protein GCM10007047_03660 [Cerasicoccus arenae]|uniref:Uncharacterized protein n=1 Tax=Cerasicoccus arenae TaxID=424488 RepID=A0A8J3DEN1_9BACT|nr:hypothetical protein GCM10007047_03660 [Cerasicoccus arenae]
MVSKQRQMLIKASIEEKLDILWGQRLKANSGPKQNRAGWRRGYRLLCSGFLPKYLKYILN